LSVLRYTDSDYPFGIFKLLLLNLLINLRGNQWDNREWTIA